MVDYPLGRFRTFLLWHYTCGKYSATSENLRATWFPHERANPLASRALYGKLIGFPDQLDDDVHCGGALRG